MRVIERSELRDEAGVISLENRIRGTLRFGRRWFSEMETQEVVTQRLNGVLGNDYVLVRNLILPGTPTAVPMILIGPQGVRAIASTSVRGVFRAKAEEWLSFSGGGRFRRVRPNLQQLVLGHAEAVLKYLTGQGFPLPEVEAILIFTNPRTHVDTARPRARIVMADGIEHMAASLIQLRPIMDHEDVEAVLNALQHPRGLQAEPEPVPLEPMPEAAPGLGTGGPAIDLEQRLRAEPQAWPAEVSEAEEFIEEAPFQASDLVPMLERRISEGAPKVDRAVERFEGGVGRIAARGARRLPAFSMRQWVLLGILAFFEIIVLIAMTVLVLRDVLFG